MRWFAAAMTGLFAISLAAQVLPLGTASAGTQAGIVHDEIVLDTPTQGVPQVRDGQVWAIAEWGDLVIVGGDFSTVKVPGGSLIARSNIFAFSKSTNQIDDRFAPIVDRSVRAIAIDPDGRGLFIGGYFTTVNGEFRPGLVFLDRDGDRVPNWSGRPNGQVSDLDVLGRDLYIGGKFTKMSGVDRDVFATVDVATGATTSESGVTYSDARYTQFQGELEIRRFEISADGTRMVVLGNFQRVDGLVRDQVAVIDVAASPDRVANWSTEWFDEPCNASTTIWPYFVRDVSISPDSSYFAVATVGGLQEAPPNPCDQLTRFEMANGLDQSPTWAQYAGGDSVTSVEVTGEAVYVGGHFRWLNNPFGYNDAGPGAIARKSLAALDPATGAVLPWDPGRQPRGKGVLVMETTEDGLWIGHDTDWVNDIFSPRLTHFSLPNPPPTTTTTTTVPSSTTTTTPGSTTTTQPGGEVVVYSTGFDGANNWVTDPTGSDTATTGAWEAGSPEQTEVGVILQRGDVTSGSAALVTDPEAGTGAGSFDVDGGVTTARSPAFTIPADASSATLSFDWYFGHLDNATGDDFFRVEVLDGAATATVLSVNGQAIDRGAAWQNATADLSAYAGRTIRLRVSAADNAGGSLIEAGVDTVSVRAVIPTTTTTTTTQPPTTTTTTQPPTTTTQPPTTTTQPPTPFVDGAVIELTNVLYNARLAASGGDAVTSSGGGDAVRWVLGTAGGGNWYLRNVQSGDYLDGDSANIDTFGQQGPDRVWEFIEVAPGQFHLRNVQYDRIVDANGADDPVAWDPPPAEDDDRWIVTRVG